MTKRLVVKSLSSTYVEKCPKFFDSKRKGQYFSDCKKCKDYKGFNGVYVYCAIEKEAER